MSFRVYDFRDTDIMSKLADTEGSGITSIELAGELGANSDTKANAIGIRLAWMRKWGMVDLDPSKHLWTLSEGGGRVLKSQRLAAVKKVIDAMPDEEMIEVMAHITSVYRRGDPMIATMLRREFQYGTSPLSAAWGR